MPLPKIDLPVYDFTIPSNGKVIRVRPFTVKEEKLLLIAIESKVAADIIATVKQVINNCVQDDNIDVDKLPFFDIDYLFIFLRAKSIGESIEVNLTCNNMVNDKPCGNVFPAMMDISKCEIEGGKQDNDIKLSGSQGVRMRYPNYAAMKRVEFGNEVDEKTNTIVNAIDYVYDAKGMYSWKDYSKEELKEFVEGLTEANYNQMMAFVDNFPTFAVKLEQTCNKCGFHHNVRYTDFYDFFM